MEKTADTVKIYVMYDIACTLYKHLKVWNTQIAMKYAIKMFTKTVSWKR